MGNQASRKIAAIWGLIALAAIIMIIGGTSFAGNNQSSAELTCGPLAQEAESATLFGAMKIGEENGRKYIYTPEGIDQSGSAPDAENRAEFCIDVAKAGKYAIHGTVSAEKDTTDSFWVVANSKSYLWDTTFGKGFIKMPISDRKSGGAEVELNLTVGEAIISIHNREAGAKLDKIELILISEADVPVDEPEPTNTPQVVEDSCGDVYQEAEDGELFGRMQIGNRSDASNKKFVFVPDEVGQSTDKIDLENRAEYCVTVPEDGKYRIRAAADAPDGGRDSLYVTVDGLPAEGYLWQPSQGDGFVEDVIHNRGANDEQIIILKKGDHTVAFHHREPRTMLDWFELELVSASPVVQDPTPTQGAATATVEPPSATAAPPTATSPAPTSTNPAPTSTPSEITCNGLIAEAESGKLFGDFIVGNDEKASGGQYITIPGESGNASGNKIDLKNRADYCVTVDEAGEYYIMAWAKTPNHHLSDSFFVTVDGAPTAGYVWDVKVSDSFANSYVNGRGVTDRVSLQLSAGEHTISFHRREALTQLDRFELIFVKALGGVAPPTATPTEDGSAAPTQTPVPPSTSTPTAAAPTATSAPPTATPSSMACSDSLVVEAENGVLKGAFRTRSFVGASGNMYIYVPDVSAHGSSGRIDNENNATYCVIVPTTSTYQIKARTWAPDSNHDSFFVQVDGLPQAGHLWDVKHSKTFAEDFVNDRSKSDPTEFYLTAGEHYITIHHREAGTLLDKIELVDTAMSGAPVPVLPPATATATAVPPVPTSTAVPPTSTPVPGPPTATPTSASPVTQPSCGAMAQEAESGELFGRMVKIPDSSASSGLAIGSEQSSKLMSNADRVDFCITIEEDGEYEIAGYTKAPDFSSNSMFWTVNGAPSIGMVWHMGISSNYSFQRVSDGGSAFGGNGAKSIFLEAGNHTISFYLRESDVQLDRIEVASAKSSGGGVVPRPQPTGTPVSPGVLGDLVTRDTHTDFSNAGLTGGIPTYTNIIEVTGRSQSDIERAIESAPSGTKIILPPGVINIGNLKITKRNIILSGSGNGCGDTILRIGSADSGIYVGRGGSVGSSVSFANNANRNSKQITVSSVSPFRVGDYVLIRQNDSSVYYRSDLSRNPSESWVKNNATQMNRIVAIEGKTLVLEGGLNLDYTTSLNARVAKVSNVISGVGIENLTIERTVDDYASSGTANIYFKYAAYSWVKGVHSKNAVRAHVTFSRSYKSEVRGMFLNAAYNNGPGGHGYGVRLDSGTADVLVENNVGKLLRHSFLVQTGGNGNVFGYNYSTDPYGEGFGEIYTDLSVHGGFGHSNLFEGNQAQHAKVDNIHGSNISNLFFRNRLEKDIDRYTYKNELLSKGATTPHIWVHENQYYNAFLANEIGFPGANSKTQTYGFDSGRRRDNFTVCKYINSSNGERGCGFTRDTTINHGTYDYLTGQTSWDSSINQRGFPNSVYLSGKPSFWGSSAWPSFGPDRLGLSESDKMIPAKLRYLNALNGQGEICYTGN